MTSATKALLIIAMLAGARPSAASEETKRVFIVASYEENHICGGPQETGVLKGMNKEGWFEGMNLKVQRFYMDTKRTNTSPGAMKTSAMKSLDEIAHFDPDVVVVVDDNAFREVGLFLAEKGEVPVVFTGMNGQPEKYNTLQHFMETRQAPGGNVTGVYEKLYAARSLKVMEAAIPGLKGKKTVGITDSSPTGDALAVQFKIEMGDLEKQNCWEVRRVKNWPEYTRLIKQLNEDPAVGAIYPVALTLAVSQEETYSAPEIFQWTVENGQKPELALNYFFSKIGLLGGAAVDFQAMGFLAGKKAGQILNGRDPGSIAIEDAPDYAIVFNLKRAQELGIEIPAPLLTAADHVYR